MSQIPPPLSATPLLPFTKTTLRDMDAVHALSPSCCSGVGLYQLVCIVTNSNPWARSSLDSGSGRTRKWMLKISKGRLYLIRPVYRSRPGHDAVVFQFPNVHTSFSQQHLFILRSTSLWVFSTAVPHFLPLTAPAGDNKQGGAFPHKSRIAQKSGGRSFHTNKNRGEKYM